MSKNFELLLQAEQQRKQKSPPDGPAWEPSTWKLAAEPPRSPLPLPENNAVREQMTMLVRQLFLLHEAVRAAVLTSVEPGDGSSWITVQCATTLAATVPGSVCVVDGNLHAPSLHGYFGVAREPGLRQAPLQEVNICQFARPVRGSSNLWLLPAGSADGSTTRAAALEHLCSHIAELRSKFDYVLIDSPALHFCGDAIMLGRSADGVAVVISEQGTHRESARHAVEQLSKSNVRVLGAVLNKRTFPIPQKIYDRI